MKYCSVWQSLPGSVAVWLEQQLEDRGIDSAIYTKYILSLLHDDSSDLTTLVASKKKGSWRLKKKKPLIFEGVKRSALVECLSAASHGASGIDTLVDELYLRLSAAAYEVKGHCLKEKTNSEFGSFVLSPPCSPSKYYSIFPSSNKETICTSSSGPDTAGWLKNIFHTNKAEGNSPRVRNSNKENFFSRSRMRSRSMVKQAQARGHTRTTAKSLDRKEAEIPTPSRLSKGKYLDSVKSRKILVDDVTVKKLSRTPGHQEGEAIVGSMEYDKYLPMDFQQLLQSPPEKSKPCFQRSTDNSTNFIQCGTNIISSIWSEGGTERMEEEAAVAAATDWDEPRNNSLWGNNSTCWVACWLDNNLNNNNNNSNNNNNIIVCNNNNNNDEKGKYWSDVESTSLAPLEGEGCFFSRLAGGNTTAFAPPKICSPAKPTLYTYKQTISDQEEDLLTSTKTHFKPIKQEVMDISESVDTNGGYADGTSFPVSSSLDKVAFERSDSGSLYLGPDQKYMEFKMKPDRDSVSSSPEPFVPKFRVNPNEKFCQTDDGDCEDEVTEGSSSEFFFPEDERLAEDMVNSLVDEDDTGEECSAGIKVEGFLTTWPIAPSSGLSNNIWSNNATAPIIPPLLPNSKSWLVEPSSPGWSVGHDAKERYIQLRNELSEDGEQLLSDLSSIHLFFESDCPAAPTSLPSDNMSKGFMSKRMRFRACTLQPPATLTQNESLLA